MLRTRLKAVVSVTARTVSGREFQVVGPFAELHPCSRNQIIGASRLSKTLTLGATMKGMTILLS